MPTTKNTELKLDVIAFVQRANAKRRLEEQRERELAERNAELETRNERALAYSTKVSRKAKERKENLEFIFAPVGIIATLGGFFHLTVYLLDLVISGGMM